LDAQHNPVAITLEPPEPVLAVAPESATGLVSLPADQISALNARADKYVRELSAIDSNAPDFSRKVEQLINLGRQEIVDAAGQSNRFLNRPTKLVDQETGVGNDLLQLRKTVEDLDPGRQGDLLKPRKLFGLISMGNKLEDYFSRYASAQTHISAILSRLAAGKDELLQDNAAIDVERQNLWSAMGRLEQMIHLSKALDKKLASAAAELQMSNPAKASAIREQALFYARQRTQDLLTQMAVSVQGYLALDLVKKNNIELVKGVERASTTTVSALRTAVMVANALTSQRLVLDQIGAVNKATASIIDSTGDLLRDNSADIHGQASAASVPLATLQQAFENIYMTMDSIDRFKAKALSSMKSTADSLSIEIEKSRSYISHAEGESVPSAGNAQSASLSPL
jgi:uncharacterized protein YaaN involved in tellurite resistance